jgi:hypothetical protein
MLESPSQTRPGLHLRAAVPHERAGRDYAWGFDINLRLYRPQLRGSVTCDEILNSDVGGGSCNDEESSAGFVQGIGGLPGGPLVLFAVAE